MAQRHWYGLEWGPNGAAWDARGHRLLADVYVFASRADRDHWVNDRREHTAAAPGYRWAASRDTARRTVGWAHRGPYVVWCSQCGNEWKDDCAAAACERDDLEAIEGAHGRPRGSPPPRGLPSPGRTTEVARTKQPEHCPGPHD